jgi:hypothetical protein
VLVTGCHDTADDNTEVASSTKFVADAGHSILTPDCDTPADSDGVIGRMVKLSIRSLFASMRLHRINSDEVVDETGQVEEREKRWEIVPNLSCSLGYRKFMSATVLPLGGKRVG